MTKLARYEPEIRYVGTGEYVAECVHDDGGEYYLAADVDAEIEALRAEVERLRTDLMESDEIREKLGHLLTRTAAALKGEPPAGVWHSWHDLPEKAAQLVERVQRDEAMSALAEQPNVKPKRTVTYVCPVCAASLERQE